MRDFDAGWDDPEALDAAEADEAIAAEDAEYEDEFSEEPDDADDAEPAGARLSDIVIIGTLFALLFGYDTMEALANLQLLPGGYEAAGIGDAVPWAMLLAGLFVPAALFIVALVVGRGRSIVARAALLLLALALNAQVALIFEEIQRHLAATALAG